MASDDLTLAPPPGPQCADCAAPVHQRRGHVAPKRCPDCTRERNRRLERERYASDSEYREKQRRRRRESARRCMRDLLVPLIVRQGALCPLCRRRLPERGGDIHVDHVVPVARGGTSDPENLQAVCAGCNLRKGAGGNPPPRDFLTAPAEESNYRAPDE